MVSMGLEGMRGAATGAVLALAAASSPALAQPVTERGVFVTQIGESSHAEVRQDNADSFVRLVQDGMNNRASVTQNGDAPHRAVVAQDGDDNSAEVRQSGEGSTDLGLLQEGQGNRASVFQTETATAMQSSAAILQRGNDNNLLLVQNGSDNSAALSQIGNGNAMTATQEGSGNRLAWSQIGDGLPDLGIVQTGGASIQITQSTTGAQFAPSPGGGGR